MNVNLQMRTVLFGSVLSLLSSPLMADNVINDDHIIIGSSCVGVDCNNGESFGFDTIRLKENNLRIKFEDTSNSATFATNDWQITINDSASGGANKFSIDDVDGGTVPFTIEATAPSNTLYLGNKGRVGFGTTTPLEKLHVVHGNSPSLRLEQDGSSGFTSQAWDVGSNEANFFIRDVTNGSRLPFRIVPGASNNSLYIAADGDVGFGTSTPDGQIDVAHSDNPNNHAFLIAPNSSVGVNIDNNSSPNGLFDVQSTGGVSNFTVASDGNVGIGTSSPSAMFNLETNDENLISTVVLENTNSAGNNARLLKLINDGSAYIVMTNSSNSAPVSEWYVGSRHDGRFSITNSENAGAEFEISASGDLTVSGTVNGTSSITTKENLLQIDPSIILSKVGNLMISKWNYIKDGASIKHIGPISEDFHEAFGLNGVNNDRISYTDLAGVALVSIQALKKEVEMSKIHEKEKDNEIHIMQEKITMLEQAIKKLITK